MSVEESNGVHSSMQNLGSPFAADGTATYNPTMQPISASTSPLPPFLLHPAGVPADPPVTATAPLNSVEPAKRKRGRPRKYAPEGSANPGMISPSPPSLSASQGGGVGGGGFSSPTPLQTVEGTVSAVKRGRGRPRGSGRKQQVARLGKYIRSEFYTLHMSY